MRIIAGIYGGRNIKQPTSRNTRPLGEKVRGALFDTLGSIDGKIVLDTYAGSGAAGFEALSRGAAQVVAIESARDAAQTIRANAESLQIAWGFQLVISSVETWVARSDTTQPFDLIIADPPYGRLEEDILEKLINHIHEDGTLALSHSSRVDSPALSNAELLQSKRYGDSTLSFYRAKSSKM